MNEIVALAAPLAESLRDWIPTAAALFTRLSLVVFLMPGIGGETVSVRIRLALAVSLMGLLLPLTERAPEIVLPLLIASEAFAGFALGFGVRIFVFALSLSGSAVAQSLSLSQILGVPSEGDSSGVVSALFSLAAATLFLTADFDVAMLRLLVGNLEALPLGFAGSVASGSAAAIATQLGAEVISFGIVLSIPFLVLNFAYYLILGFLNRAMPQLMVTFVGLPAITLSGFILLTASIGAMLTVWLARVSEVLAP